jgi:CheY-like chemotaxis protein
MDDSNYTTLMKMAFKKNNILNPVQWVGDGLEAITYLNGEGAFADRGRYPFPEVLILDLKMPRMSGFELLSWIREHPEFRVIPTIIMTSSQLDIDVERAYNLGANTYMIKPSSFEELAKMVKLAHDYWAVSVKPKTKRSKSYLARRAIRWICAKPAFPVSAHTKAGIRCASGSSTRHRAFALPGCYAVPTQSSNRAANAA